MHKISLLLMLALVGMIPSNAAAPQKEQQTYRADDKALRYVGRIQYQSDGAVSFDWSGVYMQANFTGSYVAMVASDSKYSEFNVFIDGKFVRKVDVKGAPATIVLADSLGGGQHSILLQKRTEGMEGKTTIYSFELSKGGKFSPVNKTPPRHIEFIGNSITCGYGTESDDVHMPYNPRVENSYKAFGPIIARFFDADYTLISHSGQGAAKNWDDTKQVSDYTMRERFLKLFDEGSEPYAFNQYKPDLVMIGLGTNDYSRDPKPTKEQFLDSYLQLIKSIRSRYGDVKIICVAPLAGEPVRGYLQDMVKTLADKNVLTVALDNAYIDEGHDLGASYHPNYNGHVKMAMNLIPYIAKVMQWTIPAKTIQ